MRCFTVASNIDFYVTSQYTLFGIPRCGSGTSILGIPMEDTVSFRPGTRFAPGVIRTWSQYFEFTPTEDLGIDHSVRHVTWAIYHYFRAWLRRIWKELTQWLVKPLVSGVG